MSEAVITYGSLPARFKRELKNTRIEEVESVQELKNFLRENAFWYVFLCQKDQISLCALANEISSVFNCIVVLLCSSEFLEQFIYQTRDHSVFVLSVTSSQTMIYQSLQLIEQSIRLKNSYQAQLNKEKQKLQDEKLIAQAKLLLIEKMHYSEPRAHDYIQKNAMDHSMTRAAIARIIINRLKDLDN